MVLGFLRFLRLNLKLKLWALTLLLLTLTLPLQPPPAISGLGNVPETGALGCGWVADR